MAERPLTARVDADGYVPVAGLRIPAPLVPRVIAAIRGQYPSLTEGKDDDAAIRSWLKWLVTQILVQHEGQEAMQPVEDTVLEVRRDFLTRAERAREKAVTDADAIMETVTPSTPVPPDVPAADQPVTPSAGRRRRE